MALIEKLIKRLFSNKLVTHRISDLINQLSDQKSNDNDICISIERDNNSRQFCYVTIDELIILYQHSTVFQRSLYELIRPGSRVKAYIDFEYYVDKNLDIENSNIGIKCVLKILYYLLNFQQNNIQEEKKYIDVVLKQFLVLEASTSDKISYHLIHANPSVLFEDNLTLGLFIKIVIHFSLCLIVQHKCPSFNIHFTLQKHTITDLIMVLIPYINTLRTKCTQCLLYSGYVTVAEIAHLLVLNKHNQFTLAIDLNVYCRNQQFRLYDSVKIGKKNPFHQSSYFPVDNNNDISYFELLRKSLITYLQTNDIPVVRRESNQLISTYMNNINSSTNLNNNLTNLNKLNIHINTYFVSDSNSTSISHANKLNISSETLSPAIIDLTQQQIQQFTLFVKKIIESDNLHIGYIRSCIRGNRNTDVLFFNIEGQYRFCPRKGAHHQRNTVAILIDTKNMTYTTRCKDSNCNNKSLIWKNIQ